MANDNKPMGLRPVAHLSGYNITTRRLVKDSTRALAKGDLVAIASDGKCDRYLVGEPPIGVSAQYSATNVAATVDVFIDDDIVYELQSTASKAQTVIGSNVAVTTTLGNATLGLSNYIAAGVSASPTATYPLSIIGIGTGFNRDGSQNAFGSFVKLHVVLNRRIGKAGIGI